MKSVRLVSMILLAFLSAVTLAGCVSALRAPSGGASGAIADPTASVPDRGAAPTVPSASASPSPSPVPATSTPHPATVFLDPGHGGVDTGTIGYTDDGTVVEEKTIALAIARQTASDLERDGIAVALSRANDSLPGIQPSDYEPDGTSLTANGVLDDLQRRIDRANASGARVLLSIHLNAFEDPSIGGTQTFYDSSRPFAAQNARFATLIQNDLIAALRAGGYDTPDRGITQDQDLITDRFDTLGDGYHHLVLLGPAVPGRLRPSAMPGALNESLFLSDPAEATAAAQPGTQNLIARAYTQAIEQFLGIAGSATSPITPSLLGAGARSRGSDRRSD
ncbi:MAG: N-acetylmuramoyl-L-alanine amidase family protein [Chloroflexota bacterium]